MIKRMLHDQDDYVDDTPTQVDAYISPAPRVSVQAFCASVAVATTVRAASDDRRLGKAHISVHMGGVAAAIDHYQKAPTPNVIMLETEADHDDAGAGIANGREFVEAIEDVMVGFGFEHDHVRRRRFLVVFDRSRDATHVDRKMRFA